MPKIYKHANKEPWLAANLSWLLPGIGHLYSGAYSCGVSLIVLTGFIYLSWLVSLISTRTPIIISLLINLCSRLILPVYASLCAFRFNKSRNTEDFERERTLSKDPWLAVFLSLLLPGAGHAYLRKGVFFILYVASFVGLYFISQKTIYTFIVYILFRVMVCAHAYSASQINRVKRKQPFSIFILLFICMYCMRGFFLPWVQSQFFIQTFGPLRGSSMEPTIPEGSKGIVDRFTYRWKDFMIGDIVMFTPPNNAYSNSENTACKRIIAVGGETVQVRDGDIYVDGQERKLDIQTHRDAYPGPSPPIDFLSIDNPYLAYGVDKPYKVPEDQYFVLGDNSRYSVDSRCYGAIPRENILGRVVKIYWPLRSMGVIR